MSVVLNHFGSWEFSFLDPIHKLLRPTLPVSSFINFSVEEFMLGSFYGVLEFFPVFKPSRLCYDLRSLGLDKRTTLVLKKNKRT